MEETALNILAAGFVCVGLGWVVLLWWVKKTVGIRLYKTKEEYYKEWEIVE